MISEFDSLATGGNRQKWLADALTKIPSACPLIRSVIFFHVLHDNTTTNKALDWYIKYDHPITQSIAAIINKR